MYQSRVLSYGIAGAIIFRLSIILLGTATLQSFEAVNLLLATILLYSYSRSQIVEGSVNCHKVCTSSILLSQFQFHSCSQWREPFDFPLLPSGMLEHCWCLESLMVYGCNNVVSFPLHHVWEMPSLSYLHISKCPKLISVPTRGLHCLIGLRELCIGPFSELMDFDAFQSFFDGIQELSSLRILNMYGHAHYNSLPYLLMQLSALTDMTIIGFGIKVLDFSDAMPKLRYLEICCCPLLEALSDGLVNLVSLEELKIWFCKKLQHLPSRDAMLRLTKLRHLEIVGCPKLEESCTCRSSPNSQWSKISHIPKIKFNSRTIQNLSTLVKIIKGIHEQ